MLLLVMRAHGILIKLSAPQEAAAELIVDAKYLEHSNLFCILGIQKSGFQPWCELGSDA